MSPLCGTSAGVHALCIFGNRATADRASRAGVQRRNCPKQSLSVAERYAKFFKIDFCQLWENINVDRMLALFGAGPVEGETKALIVTTTKPQ